jgi:hypothetical protein
MCCCPASSWGTSWGLQGTFRIAYAAAYIMPPEYTYALQFGPTSAAAKASNAKQQLRQGTIVADTAGTADCVWYQAQTPLRLVVLHELLSTLANAATTAIPDPAAILSDLLAANLGYVRDLAAANATFRVCGNAREILTAAMNATADVDPQVTALLRIKGSVDTTGVLTGWTVDAGANGGYCQWVGVSCNGNTVHGIELRPNKGVKGLKGVLPPAAAFEGLENLAQFILAGHQGVSGTIPEDWSQLQQLRDVRLSGNSLAGTIPSSWGNMSSLQVLYLWGNALSGRIPSSFGGLLAMQDIDLSSNALTGTIPDTLSALVALTNLMLNDNKLSGTLPSSLGALSRLEYLHLGSNRLSGSLPESLSRLVMLQELLLSYNSLTGTLPESYSALQALIVLGLAENALIGAVPASWASMADLRALHLFGNAGLNGCLPHKWEVQLAKWDVQGKVLQGTSITGFCPA